MTAHWAEKYIGQKWTDDNDCFYWFRKIELEQFKRDVPHLSVCHETAYKWMRDAARIMSGDITSGFGWMPTDNPRDGDAVFLAQKTRPHHIGVTVVFGDTISVIHALEGVGVVLSDQMSLAINGWKINGFWTPCRLDF